MATALPIRIAPGESLLDREFHSMQLRQCRHFTRLQSMSAPNRKRPFGNLSIANPLAGLWRPEKIAAAPVPLASEEVAFMKQRWSVQAVNRNRTLPRFIKQLSK